MERYTPRPAIALVYVMLLVTTAMAAYTVYDMQSTRRSLQNTFMLRPLESIEHQLKGFFQPITQLSDMAAGHALASHFSVRDTASMNRYFMPLLTSYDQITSIGVADTGGFEYDILWSANEWRTRSVHPSPDGGRYHWGCWNSTMDTALGRWSEPMQHDPRTRPWHRGALQKDGQYHWTGPYLFNTDAVPGVTLSTLHHGTDGPFIIALDVTLERVSRFMAQMRIGQQGGAFLLSRDMEPISVDAYRPPPFARVVSEVTAAYAALKGQMHHDHHLNVTIDDQRWCARIRRLDLDPTNHLYAVAVMPETEMMAQVNRTVNVIVVGMLLTMVFTGLLFLLMQRLQKANHRMQESALQVAEQSSIIAKRNSELQESFNYAKRIQQVMLPEMDRLAKATMNNVMVLYMPKDTVSGDFYWGRLRNGVSYFALADCTGHGVPGAMMSILGLDLLNATVGRDSHSLPENLLYQLRQVLIKRMTSGDVTARDGMDMGLCRLNHHTRTLHYAGAYIPLMIVRSVRSGGQLDVVSDGRARSLSPTVSSNTHHLFVIKGDRMPIGFIENDNRAIFTGHEIRLQPDDSIYMTSDGYADQFGGQDDRKFGQQRLRQTLLSLEQLPGEARRERLSEVIRAYMGEREQVDDICILGFVCTDIPA